jgi:uncharacterized protein (UPF0303 family)
VPVNTVMVKSILSAQPHARVGISHGGLHLPRGYGVPIVLGGPLTSKFSGHAESTSLIARIEAENSEIDFPSFSHADAFAVGSDLVSDGMSAGAPIAISFVFGEQRVFHAALAGTNADNDVWLDRKLRVVARHNAPSLLVGERLRAVGLDTAQLASPAALFLPAPGGGFPLRVRGSLVGGVAVSGLTELEDHDIVVGALRRFLHKRS